MRIVPPRLPNSKNWCSWGANTSVHDWIWSFLALLLYCTQGEAPGLKWVTKQNKTKKKNYKNTDFCPKKSGTKAQCLSLQCLKYGDISYMLQRLYANSLLPRARTGLKRGGGHHLSSLWHARPALQGCKIAATWDFTPTRHLKEDHSGMQACSLTALLSPVSFLLQPCP